MSLNQLKVFIHELQVGMFVSALDKPWAETPFPIQGFMIKSTADASRVKAYCDYVYVDVTKGISPLDVKSGQSAPSLPRGVQAPSGADRALMSRSVTNVAQLMTPRTFDVRPHMYSKTVEFANEIPAARRVMNNLVGCLSVVTRQIAKGTHFNIEQLQQSVDHMVDSVVRCPDAFTWLLRLRAKDSHTHDHSIRASLWATQFARHIGLDLDQLKDLCLATMLKDVGKIGMDKGLLRKSDRNADEEAEYRNFVSLSVEKLRQSGFDNRRALNIIKFHCERYDGSGFPKGCGGQRIPFLAAIAGIATEFDELCHPREAVQALTPSKATGKLYELRGRAFADDLVIEFIQSIGLYPAGTVVELTTGDKGMVVEQNAKSRLSPRLAVFEDAQLPAEEPSYIFVDLKNEDQARNQLNKFGNRRGYEVTKLAIVKDNEFDTLAVDDRLLNLLITKPFDEKFAMNKTQPKGHQGFMAALKERFVH